MLLTTFSLIACGKGPTPPPDQPGNQIVYADEIEKKDAVSFNVAQAWTATVSDVVMRSVNGNVEWLQLSAYSGLAGNQSISISLMPNFTGESRKAEIKIVSGDDTITVIVEQKATTNDNKVPQHKTVKKIKGFYNGEEKTHIDFTYDNQQRVILCKMTDVKNLRNEVYTITYSASSIKVVDESGINYTYGLDGNGRVTSVEQLVDSKLERGSYAYNAQGYLTKYPDGLYRSTDFSNKYLYTENIWDGPNIKTMVIGENSQNKREAHYQYTDKLNNGLASIDVTGGYKGQVFILLKEGSFGPKNKNLIKRETGSIATRDWSYEFDQNGNMTKFSIYNVERGDEWTEVYEIIYN